MMTSTAFVLLMIPGVGFFYSGLARRKSALSLIWLSMMSVGVVSFQWFFWGYSLTFSHTASAFIGDLSNFGFKDVLGQPSVGSSRIPDLMFAVYQGMFAAITYVFLLNFNIFSANQRFTDQPLLSEPPLIVAVCFLVSSSCSFGLLSSTTRYESIVHRYKPRH
jgi:hypothetical protein